MKKNPLIIHLLVALVWLFLSGQSTFGNFLVALVVTFALLALFRKAIGCEAYVRRVLGLLRFLAYFTYDAILSNLRIMRIALSRDAGTIEGDFVFYNIEGLSELEVFLIAHSIGLSPGTMAADRSPDGRHLVLHVFGTDDPESVCGKIDETLKAGILSFTR